MNKLNIILISIILSMTFLKAGDNNYKIYTDIKEMPAKKAALVLGTAKYIAKGKINYFYKYRIDATVKLWKANKIKAVVVSGDDGSHFFDEANAMYKDLIKKGIPAKYITRDFGGFRTFDSVVRAKEIFDLDDYIIVTQEFHLKRALYLAKGKSHDAIGFAAKSLKGTKSLQKMEEREKLAMIKAYLDLNILNTKPKVMGKKIKVNYRK